MLLIYTTQHTVDFNPCMQDTSTSVANCHRTNYEDYLDNRGIFERYFSSVINSTLEEMPV